LRLPVSRISRDDFYDRRPSRIADRSLGRSGRRPAFCEVQPVRGPTTASKACHLQFPAARRRFGFHGRRGYRDGRRLSSASRRRPQEHNDRKFIVPPERICERGEVIVAGLLAELKFESDAAGRKSARNLCFELKMCGGRPEGLGEIEPVCIGCGTQAIRLTRVSRRLMLLNVGSPRCSH
jgi:hypothetical protein